MLRKSVAVLAQNVGSIPIDIIPLPKACPANSAESLGSAYISCWSPSSPRIQVVFPKGEGANLTGDSGNAGSALMSPCSSRSQSPRANDDIFSMDV